MRRGAGGGGAKRYFLDFVVAANKEYKPITCKMVQSRVETCLNKTFLCASSRDMEKNDSESTGGKPVNLQHVMVSLTLHCNDMSVSHVKLWMLSQCAFF